MRDLNAAANIAIISATVGVIVVAVVDVASAVHSLPAATSPYGRASPTLISGGKAPVVGDVDYGCARRTLVLFLSVHCRYCKLGSPFYRDVAAQVAHNRDVQIAAAFPQGRGEVSEYAARERLPVKLLSGIRFVPLGVSSTPTEILVDQKGLLVHAWVGTPDEGVRKDILARLFSGAH